MQNVRMAIGSLVLGLYIFTTGCGKHEAVKEMEKMADEVCKCKDLTCAQDVATKGQEKMQKFKDEKVSKSDEEAAMKAANKMSECMAKLTTAGTGAAAGAAPGGEPGAAPSGGTPPSGAEPSANPAGSPSGNTP